MRNRYSLKVEGIKHVPEDEQHEDVDFTLLNPVLDSETIVSGLTISLIQIITNQSHMF